MSYNVGALAVYLNGITRDFDRSFITAEERLKSFERRAMMTGKTISRVGQRMTMALTLPAVGAAAAVSKLGLDFSKGLEFANTMLKLTDKEMKIFSKDVLRLSDDVGKSAADIARSAYPIASVLHTTGAETMKILEAAVKGAKAGKISTEAATNAMIRSMSIYQIAAEDSMALVDDLSATVREGNATWEDMANVLPNVLASAKPLGISLKEAAAGFALTSSMAGSSEEAATGVIGVFTALMKPTDELKAALATIADKWGLTGDASAQAMIAARGFVPLMSELSGAVGGSAEKLSELIPRVRGVRGAVAMFQEDGDRLRRTLDGVTNSAGETQAQIDAGRGPMVRFIESLNRVRNAAIRTFSLLEPYFTKTAEAIGAWMEKIGKAPATMDLLRSAGQGLLDVLQPIGKVIRWLIGEWNALDDSTKRWLARLVGMAIVAGPVLNITGKLVIGIGLLAKGFRLGTTAAHFLAGRLVTMSAALKAVAFSNMAKTAAESTAATAHLAKTIAMTSKTSLYAATATATLAKQMVLGTQGVQKTGIAWTALGAALSKRTGFVLITRSITASSLALQGFVGHLHKAMAALRAFSMQNFISSLRMSTIASLRFSTSLMGIKTAVTLATTNLVVFMASIKTFIAGINIAAAGTAAIATTIGIGLVAAAVAGGIAIYKFIKVVFELRTATKALKKSMEDLQGTLAGQAARFGTFSTEVLRDMRRARDVVLGTAKDMEDAFSLIDNVYADMFDTKQLMVLKKSVAEAFALFHDMTTDDLIQEIVIQADKYEAPEVQDLVFRVQAAIQTGDLDKARGLMEKLTKAAAQYKSPELDRLIQKITLAVEPYEPPELPPIDQVVKVVTEEYIPPDVEEMIQKITVFSEKYEAPGLNDLIQKIKMSAEDYESPVMLDLIQQIFTATEEYIPPELKALVQEINLETMDFMPPELQALVQEVLLDVGIKDDPDADKNERNERNENRFAGAAERGSVEAYRAEIGQGNGMKQLNRDIKNQVKEQKNTINAIEDLETVIVALAPGEVLAL